MGLSAIAPAPTSGQKRQQREAVAVEAQKQHRHNMASMWAKYRVDEPTFRAMMDAQQGVCHICSTDFGLHSKRACLDHDHYTGQPRGLLCTQCNTRIGWLEKNIYRLLPYLQQR